MNPRFHMTDHMGKSRFVRGGCLMVYSSGGLSVAALCCSLFDSLIISYLIILNQGYYGVISILRPTLDPSCQHNSAKAIGVLMLTRWHFLLKRKKEKILKNKYFQLLPLWQSATTPAVLQSLLLLPFFCVHQQFLGPLPLAGTCWLSWTQNTDSEGHVAGKFGQGCKMWPISPTTLARESNLLLFLIGDTWRY